MKIIVCGSRYWKDRLIIYDVLSKLSKDTIIIHGAPLGADSLAGEIAELLGLQVISVPANWYRLGKSAGMVRNKLMLDMSPDLVIAFHNNLAESKGTKHMISIAHKANIPVKLYPEQEARKL